MQSIREAEADISELDRQRFALIDSIADLTALRDTRNTKRTTATTADAPPASAVDSVRSVGAAAAETASPRRSKTAELIAKADELIKAHTQPEASRSPRLARTYL